MLHASGGRTHSGIHDPGLQLTEEPAAQAENAAAGMKHPHLTAGTHSDWDSVWRSRTHIENVVSSTSLLFIDLHQKLIFIIETPALLICPLYNIEDYSRVY